MESSKNRQPRVVGGRSGARLASAYDLKVVNHENGPSWESLGECPSGRWIKIVWRYNQVGDEDKVFVIAAYCNEDANSTPVADTRAPSQIQIDEAVACAAESGSWEEFETEELLTDEGAKLLLEHAGSLEASAMLAEVTKQPFRWKHLVFRILRCEYADGKARVETAPHDAQFVAEVRKRIEQNRFHYLPYYQGFGFISFPEDYSRYRD